jgi:membrane protease YdiL (CAAX protease family)
LPTDANPLIQQEYRPVPGWSLLLFAATLAVVLVLLRLFGAASLLGLNMFALMAAFFAIGLFAVAVAVAPLGRAAFPALGLRPANWKYLVFGALGTLALSVAVSQLGIEPQGMKQVIDMVPGKIGVSLVIFSVLAPIVEELIFRGLLYGWVAGRWGGTAGLVVSSLLFAAAHLEPAHIILVLPLGFLFGWLRRRTDSLLPSMFSHIVNNGAALLAAAYLPGI